MSYDVSVGDRDLNHTVNQRPMWVEYGVDPRGWHGRLRYDVAPEIAAALRRMIVDRARDRAAFAARWNSPNGWGTADTGISFLVACYLGCVAELPDRIDVSW